jgi:hypothetical protein
MDKTNLEHYKCASGFYVDLIMELSNKLQFTFDVYEVEDKAWGGRSKSGEWNGLMKDLITNKADLAMTSLKVTTERSQFIDFTVPFMETVINKSFSENRNLESSISLFNRVLLLL